MIDISLAALGMVLTLIAGLLIGVGWRPFPDKEE